MDLNRSKDESDSSFHERSQDLEQILTRVNELTEDINKSKILHDRILTENRRLNDNIQRLDYEIQRLNNENQRINEENRRLRFENEFLHREMEKLRKPPKSNCCCIHLIQCLFGNNRREEVEEAREQYQPAVASQQ